ncbi:amino acid transporter [Loigolactobacillus bifermentans DSM 20003]|uniref:Amino acid transporter n=1 Tax=Loigolactobacillus bifermentans DSM 20003 TaxID=1423726 RepID=A0A0R1H1T3_9LACO|nr:amino acid transporter [Loigolactobacillus bifermentans DSM 20003]
MKKNVSPLKRTLRTWDLTFLGIGAIIGTGIFVLTGKGALTAGPALSVSFLIAAICCGFAALCYAEFASIAPVAGSAYTYAYVAFGEIIAFIIGWDLILEYALSAATVSAGWSGYFVNLLDNLGIHIPTILTAAAGTTPGVTTVFNLPAFIIVLVITWIISNGITQTKRTNDTMVIIKLAVIVLFIICTVWFIKPQNWHPFNPFGLYSCHNGTATGIIPAASIVFFSFIGFDAVSSSAEETINPSKTLPRGILLSLVISTILYIIMTLIMTGVVPFKLFSK